MPTGERYPALNLTPQKRKEKTLKALLDQIEGLATRQPVLMVFEDAHWVGSDHPGVAAPGLLVIITFPSRWSSLG
jgi:hypothetical protein